jgi:PAB-dependent poly(A)-specific ribonuclease subunit 2
MVSLTIQSELLETKGPPVSPSSREESAENEWHIFNDFLVHKITREEALRFDPAWKMPSIIGYQIKSARHVIDDSWKQSLDPSILYRHWSQKSVDPCLIDFATNKERSQETDPKKLRLLSPETEKPRAGTPVAIDAEFVELQSEEIEIRADGTRETRRPSRLGLARVSVLRGEGVDEGLPFMDDYIIMKEPVVDYLTQYSGIHPGDLDPATSSHQLVSLKVAYKKLWLLLNLGCVFVGHGLSKDFRIINIHVPRSQVVDTADLFFIKERFRKLKLSFLAWYILHEDIQTDHGHDSVEDARTALRLWRKYEEFKDAGVLEQMLRETYKKGAEIGYLPPGARREHKEKDAGKGGDAAGEDSKSLKGMQTPEKGSRAGTPSGFGMTPRQSFGGRNAFGSPLR